MSSRIETFNEKYNPFYIVSHSHGQYSLCYAIDFTTHPYRQQWQEAFNHYADQNGEPAQEFGCYTHGSGYEWEEVFKKAFSKDPNISRVKYDSELGGFFCYSNSLTVLEDFGKRFYALCNNKEQFSKLVSDVLTDFYNGATDIADMQKSENICM